MPSPLLSADVVSPRVYGLILDSEPLSPRLLPQGLIGSPYEILDHQATLVLTDAKGCLAIFRRTQRVRFLQDGSTFDPDAGSASRSPSGSPCIGPRAKRTRSGAISAAGRT